MIALILQLAALFLFVCAGCGKETFTYGSVTIHTIGFGLAFMLAGSMAGGWSWRKRPS